MRRSTVKDDDGISIPDPRRTSLGTYIRCPFLEQLNYLYEMLYFHLTKLVGA